MTTPAGAAEHPAWQPGTLRWTSPRTPDQGSPVTVTFTPDDITRTLDLIESMPRAERKALALAAFDIAVSVAIVDGLEDALTGGPDAG